MTPEVSVILPVYNRRGMAREAVESVRAQRDIICELIVVDDGSTDGTADELEVVAGIAEPAAGISMRVLRSGANRGVAASRNAGIRLARAELIAFLDSDDLWAPAKLRRQVDFMRAHPEYLLAQTGELWIRAGRRVNPGSRHQKRAGELFLPSLRTCLISPSAVILRTALFRAIGGFDETMTAGEDYDLWLRILRDYPAGLIEEPLVTRRAGHPGQLSAEVPALDRFRILALLKLLADTGDGAIARTALSRERRRAVVEVLTQKCRIYAQGLARRQKTRLAAAINQIADDAPAWVVSADSRLYAALGWFRAMLAAPCESGLRPSRAEAAA